MSQLILGLLLIAGPILILVLIYKAQEANETEWDKNNRKRIEAERRALEKREKSLRSKEYLLARSVAQHMLQLVREDIVRSRDLSEAERLSIDVLIADIHGHLSNLIYMANWCLVWCKFGVHFFDIYTHIFQEYKARMAESIEKDLI